MSMDYRRAAKVLGDQLKALGYTWELSGNHTHPRLYIRSGGEGRFTVLSSTSNYDQGNLLKIKRADIARDVLPHLPKPQAPDEKEALKIAPLFVLEPDRRVFGIKVFVMGRGSLVVNIPRSAIPEGKEKASAFLTSENHLFLVFSEESGKDHSSTKSESRVAYYFKRSEVDFRYAEKVEKGYKSPEMCARLQGDSLVCDEPLPPTLLTGKIVKTKISLDDGKELLNMLNEWMQKAEKENLNPILSVENNRLHIRVEVKVSQEL